VGEFTGLIALPEFMSIEAPGGITHERFYPGEFDPDTQDSFGTNPGDLALLFPCFSISTRNDQSMITHGNAPLETI
jgi:hypothetical protein